MRSLYPKVSIVVLNYNGKDCLRGSLASLFCLGYPNFEVVAVDNNSIDGSLESARQSFSRATFIKNEHNLGFSAGNNVGIKYSLERMAEYVLLLNNDTVVKKDFLSRLIESAESDKTVGILSPLIFARDGRAVWFSGGKIDWLRMKTEHKKELIESNFTRSDFISGCAMLVRAEVFTKIGLLDEDFFLYWEDADFSVRAKKAGFGLLVVAGAQITHLEKSEEVRKNKVYWLVLSGLLFFRKNVPNCLKLWIPAYTFLRRVKNWNDVRKNKTEINLAVQKAYRDFSKLKCKK
ncbi:MAG: glycosyltransferase family 2 protein [Candidatus Moranbacteria bacterium]|nr:glycosyltransferase family 2 protein [Candidatus Moranbacteria bacterium]